MDRVVELLTEKNQCLERFSRLNESEIIRFSEGNFDSLEQFYQSRETILTMIQKIEKLVIENQQLEEFPRIIPAEHKKSLLKVLARKNDLVTEILSQDLQILSLIEQAKSNIIKELSQVKTARKAMKGYDSKMRDHRLDENY